MRCCHCARRLEGLTIVFWYLEEPHCDECYVACRESCEKVVQQQRQQRPDDGHAAAGLAALAAIGAALAPVVSDVTIVRFMNLELT